MIIGVTGLIGSGKSQVAAVFGSLGAEVVNADAIGREVVDSDPGLLYSLVLEFGDAILTPQKTLNRRQLGQLAFASPSGATRLNRIVHPALLNRLDGYVADARRKKTILVIDAALLIFWNYHKRTDTTVLISATKAIRRTRALAAGLTRMEFEQRTKAQLPERILRKETDYVLSNNGTLKDLQRRAEKLYLQIVELG